MQRRGRQDRNGNCSPSLSSIMAALPETTGEIIGMDIFISDMEKLMRQAAAYLMFSMENGLSVQDL